MNKKKRTFYETKSKLPILKSSGEDASLLTIKRRKKNVVLTSNMK